ncbi:peptide ABC transporter permease [Haematobacter missouriensis]|uniref:ABC transporter permease n=2 Tax=Haematobacter TaxID=366614 RepID=A0A212ANA9_9RHOB|nr:MULTISPECIES: ABC transporter permease [Haematobacter]KFI25191.1 peptide ABC transporter permease [Haematobacter missouriensis]OWJ70690.1 ABC transporter permease [Haematobacter missouriensis]OWJ80247.1 ABC transporter permease [Haematobacter genomosp. 1]OWJ82955.1 ABC transporter permease [Haematobacter missouriensis]
MKLSPNLLIGLTIFFIVLILAVFAPIIAPFDPVADSNLMFSEEPPSARFWFGTDEQGRDIFSRIVYGARISLTIGLAVQLMNTVIGVCLGLSAGYLGGWWDEVVQGLTNLMLSIPTVVFALALMTILGPGILSLLIALGLTDWAYSCRISRAQVLSHKGQNYVQAARTMGFGRGHIMFREILPNIAGPLVVVATMGIGSAIMAEAALSFLGLGVVPPDPSWGSMLSRAREQLMTTPWVAIFPGLALFVTVLGFNLLGDGLRDLLDPHGKARRA